MPNAMAAQPNIGGTLCVSSAIPFLVPRHKACLMAAAIVPCSHNANIEECKTWTQSEFCSWQNSIRGQEPSKCTHSAPAQETAKHRAKFGWPLASNAEHCSNEAKTRNRLKFAGVPQTRQQISAVSGPKFTIL